MLTNRELLQEITSNPKLIVDFLKHLEKTSHSVKSREANKDNIPKEFKDKKKSDIESVIMEFIVEHKDNLSKEINAYFTYDKSEEIGNRLLILRNYVPTLFSFFYMERNPHQEKSWGKQTREDIEAKELAAKKTQKQNSKKKLRKMN